MENVPLLAEPSGMNPNTEIQFKRQRLQCDYYAKYNLRDLVQALKCQALRNYTTYRKRNKCSSLIYFITGLKTIFMMEYIKPTFLLLFVLGIVASVSSRHAAKHYPQKYAGNQDESSLVRKVNKSSAISLSTLACH